MFLSQLGRLAEGECPPAVEHLVTECLSYLFSVPYLMPCRAPDSAAPPTPPREAGKDLEPLAGHKQRDPVSPIRPARSRLTVFAWSAVEDAWPHLLSAGKLSKPPSHSHLGLGILFPPSAPRPFKLSWTLITVSDLQPPILF